MNKRTASDTFHQTAFFIYAPTKKNPLVFSNGARVLAILVPLPNGERETSNSREKYFIHLN